MKLLYVYYENQLVGELTQDDELVFGFKYTASWLSQADTFPLSLALPLQQEAFGNRATLLFFENLLPEGDVKKIWNEPRACPAYLIFSKTTVKTAPEPSSSRIKKISSCCAKRMSEISTHLVDDIPCQNRTRMLRDV